MSGFWWFVLWKNLHENCSSLKWIVDDISKAIDCIFTWSYKCEHNVNSDVWRICTFDATFNSISFHLFHLRIFYCQMYMIGLDTSSTTSMKFSPETDIYLGGQFS